MLVVGSVLLLMLLFSVLLASFFLVHDTTSQWGAADAEIKVPFGENTELKLSPFKAWSRSIQPHKLRLLPGIFSWLISTLPVHSPAFFPKPLPIFPLLALM